MKNLLVVYIYISGEMDDIEKMWGDIKLEYIDMYSRLSYISRKGGKILERRPIKDKLHLLISDFKEVLNTMEKVCNSIDEIYADQGMINMERDANFSVRSVKHVSDSGKVVKVIRAMRDETVGA
ncbi:MAG: hypothetical protein Hyperionvirus25_18 [Hyperionvirus sp.]|uniref:Uncharacterized protein n=1 Tax=Hyperionvirus sp. TaxID=2487770 RepID=A0A3G5ABD8_9VIRU|nr:MAG: hypothetical protein Hyperionvirus25_18 [Hyperionvirus sp.]